MLAHPERLHVRLQRLREARQYNDHGERLQPSPKGLLPANNSMRDFCSGHARGIKGDVEMEECGLPDSAFGRFSITL